MLRVSESARTSVGVQTSVSVIWLDLELELELRVGPLDLELQLELEPGAGALDWTERPTQRTARAFAARVQLPLHVRRVFSRPSPPRSGASACRLRDLDSAGSARGRMSIIGIDSPRGLGAHGIAKVERGGRLELRVCLFGAAERGPAFRQ